MFFLRFAHAFNVFSNTILFTHTHSNKIFAVTNECVCVSEINMVAIDDIFSHYDLSISMTVYFHKFPSLTWL